MTPKIELEVSIHLRNFNPSFAQQLYSIYSLPILYKLLSLTSVVSIVTLNVLGSERIHLTLQFYQMDPLFINSGVCIFNINILFLLAVFYVREGEWQDLKDCLDSAALPKGITLSSLIINAY